MHVFFYFAKKSPMRCVAWHKRFKAIVNVWIDCFIAFEMWQLTLSHHASSTYCKSSVMFTTFVTIIFFFMIQVWPNITKQNDNDMMIVLTANLTGAFFHCHRKKIHKFHITIISFRLRLTDWKKKFALYSEVTELKSVANFAQKSLLCTQRFDFDLAKIF